MLNQILGVAKLVGLDPKTAAAGLANQFSREQVRKRFHAAIPSVAARLEADGLTPAAKAADPAGERVFIRSAMYLIAKHALTIVLPKGANVVADHLRDGADDAVVPRVAPQIGVSTPTTEALAIIADAFVEQLF